MKNNDSFWGRFSSWLSGEDKQCDVLLTKAPVVEKKPFLFPETEREYGRFLEEAKSLFNSD